MIQLEFIEYAKRFSYENRVHIKLGGSFSKGTATEFSDVDIYMYTDDRNILQKFIYNYAKPVYISQTENPKGILIVVYENDVAIDLEIVKGDILEDNYFSKKCSDEIIEINSDIAGKFVLSENYFYSFARLFHRSLIKYLAGKKELGTNILKEIAEIVDVKYKEEQTYKYNYGIILEKFEERFALPQEYKNILIGLSNNINGE